jgi:putative transposase
VLQARRLLLADLRVERTHSRPHVSNDNPFSESAFRTLKYRPAFSARFGSLEDARVFCSDLFTRYNGEHRRSGIGLLTPAVVHAGRAAEVTAARAITLTRAYKAHPERFVRRPPTPPEVPTAVRINPPAKREEESPQ